MSLCKERRANIVVRSGVGRIELNGSSVGGNRLIQLVLLQKRVAEQQMSIDTIRLESQSALRVAHRFRVPAHRDKRKAHVLVEICASVIQGKRSSDHVDGDFGAADLDGDETKMMEAPDMLWIGGQGRLIEVNRLDQLPFLEALIALREQQSG